VSSAYPALWGRGEGFACAHDTGIVARRGVRASSRFKPTWARLAQQPLRQQKGSLRIKRKNATRVRASPVQHFRTVLPATATEPPECRDLSHVTRARGHPGCPSAKRRWAEPSRCLSPRPAASWGGTPTRSRTGRSCPRPLALWHFVSARPLSTARHFNHLFSPEAVLSAYFSIYVRTCSVIFTNMNSTKEFERRP